MTEELFVVDREEWRQFLQKNHDTKNGVWLIFYKKHTGNPGVTYDDAVEEALCFGWIDSIIRKIDDERFARKFTPRTGKSKWSEANKERALKMIRDGKMTEVGMDKIKEAQRSGEWWKPAPEGKELAVPPDLEKALMANRQALENFKRLAKSYRRHFVGWVASAKREDTRKRRIVEAISLLERNEKLGMK
jgi:uncharacterized protein YdeI (YjbR/CyaY-like superfamily)